MSLAARPTFQPITSEQPARIVDTFSPVRLPARASSPRVAIKEKRRIVFISLADIVAVEAEGNYVSLHGNTGSHLLRDSISALEARLGPYGFIRIHRSALVNKAFVEEIRSFPTGEYGLRVKGGKEYKVTRTFKKNLKSIAEFWIGTGSFLA
jgi:DNA-binding LytR/AlgR family response regulator